jgi:hypothetical protein
VEGYQRRPLGTTRGDIETAARETLDEAGAFLRRLIPLPGADAVVSPLSLLPMPGLSGTAPSNPVNAVADIVADPAASIVSQAASVLDEEMAKGVLAARRSAGTAQYGPSSASNPLLRQVHELVDNFAAVWPSLPSAPAQRPFASQPMATEADGLAELKPRATVQPGQRATISMTLCNSESRSVRLVPAATDLLGSRGGRIPCSLLEFTPSEITLEPQEQRDLAIATTVPVDTTPGCYSGLLVVRGLDYLRGLITIEVG